VGDPVTLLLVLTSEYLKNVLFLNVKVLVALFSY